MTKAEEECIEALRFLVKVKSVSDQYEFNGKGGVKGRPRKASNYPKLKRLKVRAWLRAQRALYKLQEEYEAQERQAQKDEAS